MQTSSAGRIAIVTGTSRGIGAAVAERLLERSWTVIGIARHQGAVRHRAYRHLEFDLSESAALGSGLEPALRDALRDLPIVRVGLVNNAAAGGVLGPIETIDAVHLLRLSAVNWVAPTWLMGFVLRSVPTSAALRIVNVSSGAALRPFPGLSDYCGSKAALRMTGMVAAAELESPARTVAAPPDTAILSYEPGTVDTEMQAEARSRPLAEYPWAGLFRDFAARGMLVPPAAPAADIVDFLESDGQPVFTERRFGAPR